MKRTKAKKSESLSMILMKGFVALTVIGIVLVIILFVTNYYLPKLFHIQPKTYNIESYADKLRQERYTEIPTKSIFGKSGYIEVLDEDANVIYSSRQKSRKHYDKQSLRYISNIYPDVYYSVEVISMDYQENSGYLIIQYRWKKKAIVTGVALLDGKRNVKYSNIDLGRKRLKKKEIKYLVDSTDDEFSGGNIVQKYQFCTDTGKNRTVLIHTESVGKRMGKLYTRIFSISMTLFILAAIAAVTLVGLYIINKVRRPLQYLENSMIGFSEGRISPERMYDGPREIVTVIDTFNAMEKKIREGEKQQEELRRQKQQMLSGVSHDLKTPITVVKGYVDAIRDGLVPPEEQDRYLAIIENKVNLMVDLINSLSDFNNLDHPDFAYHMTYGNLTEYLREFIAAKYQELDLAGYYIEADIPEKNIMMNFDHQQLKRVWENIIGNTVKYTEPGTTLYISLHKSADGGAAIIRLGDDGPGIPEYMKDVLFDPFVVAEPSRSNGQGTGLGLAVAKKIIEVHNGTIEIEKVPENSAGQGLFYRMTLPIQ